MVFMWTQKINLKLVELLTYLGNNIPSTVFDVNINLDKVWTAIERLKTLRKSDF